MFPCMDHLQKTHQLLPAHRQNYFGRFSALEQENSQSGSWCQKSSSEDMSENLACHSLQTECLSFPLCCISVGQIHPHRLKVVGICIKAELTIQNFLMAQHCSIHYEGVSFISHFQSLLFKLFIYLLIFHFSMCTGILIEGCVTCFRHLAG